jgi:hypothetical protein
MAKIVPISIPVVNSDGLIIDRADRARARQLALAPNATVVHKRRACGGEFAAVCGFRKCSVCPRSVVRIILADIADDSLMEAAHLNPRRYTFLQVVPSCPEGVYSLKHLATETADLYRLAVTDCLKTAA